MFAMNKIVLPVDFHEGAAGAARHAAALSRHFHSEIAVVHVIPPMYFGMGLEGMNIGIAREVLDNAAEKAQKQLETFLEAVLNGLAVRRVLLEGDPARRIVQFAHEEKANLIVMPTHGYGLFRRFILGSVTAKLLHDAQCPVWTGVHLEDTPAAEWMPIRSVLCAVDLSPHSRATLCWAAQIAAEFGARLSLVHATAPLEITARAGSYFAPEWRGVLIESANAEIAKLQQSLGTQAESFVESGEAPKVVRQIAGQTNADLLVIGRSPTSGIAGRLRTNAYAIIRESPCPVASV